MHCTLKGHWTDKDAVISKYEVSGSFSGSNWGELQPTGGELSLECVQIDTVDESGFLRTTEVYYDSGKLADALHLSG
jgi:hypothetical protein